MLIHEMSEVSGRDVNAFEKDTINDHFEQH
jgi:hypothetical protein